MFSFFLKSYRSGILEFCGSDVKVKGDSRSPESKYCFREFDNGKDISDLVTRQPNVLRSVIIGKKSWGLWKNQWSEGVSDGLFRLHEITDEFDKRGIKIPEPLMRDFENTIRRMIHG